MTDIKNEAKMEKTIASVAVKLPKFNNFHPEVWRKTVEAHFRNAKITVQQTMYDHVLATLDIEIVVEIDDLMNPPTINRFDKLCDILVERFGSTQEEKSKRMMNLGPLGYRKPSQFLRHLQRLAGKPIGEDDRLQEMVLARLPGNIRQILRTLKITIEAKRISGRRNDDG